MVELRRTYARGAGVSSARACGLGAFPPTFLQYVLDFTVVKARLPSSETHNPGPEISPFTALLLRRKYLHTPLQNSRPSVFFFLSFSFFEIPVWWRRRGVPSSHPSWRVYFLSPGDAVIGTRSSFPTQTEHCRGLKSAQVSQGTMPGVNTTNSNN